MVTDSELTRDLAALVESVDVPEVPLAQIRRRMREEPGASTRGRFTIPAIAAATLAAVVAVPVFAPVFAQTIEAKIAAILHWAPPSVPPPPALKDAMKPQTMSLAQAQTHVRFTIVPPTGLPPNVSDVTIAVARSGIYSSSGKAWAVGPAVVSFYYTRPGGGAFFLTASAASPRNAPPPKYIYEDKDVDASGNPILVKREHFAWRNGDQIMTATTSDGISAAEIASIESAMHGTSIPTVWPPAHGNDVMRLRLVPPQKP